MAGPAPASARHQVGAEGARVDLHPGEHLRKHVFKAQPKKVYSAAARLLVLLFASYMQKDDRGEWCCWVSLKTVARLAGLGYSTACRVMLKELVDGPLPLLARHRHKSVVRRGVVVNEGASTFVLSYIWEPAKFAFQRDLARSTQPSPSPRVTRRRSNLPKQPGAAGASSATISPAGDTLAQIRAWRAQNPAAVEGNEQDEHSGKCSICSTKTYDGKSSSGIDGVGAELGGCAHCEQGELLTASKAH